jgi:hypothetical protein
VSQTTGDGGGEPAERAEETDPGYLDGVMAEIDAEVRRRRAAGDLPARLERELDELFLAHSPVAGRGGALSDALHMVDRAAFINPVVPIDSNKSGGAVVKKGLRTLSLWYVGYVTHQVSQFASAVSRSLHLLDEQLVALRRELEEQRPLPAPVVELADLRGPDAWWLTEVTGALERGLSGRVLHAACGDGWLVRLLGSQGIDAYGVDPRPGRAQGDSGPADLDTDTADLREENLLDHLRSVELAALGGVVLSGTVDGMTGGQRAQLLDLVTERLSPGGTLIVHSLSPAAWAGDEVPPEADLAPGRPLRGATWPHLLDRLGYSSSVREGPKGDDYLVVALLGPGGTAARRSSTR